MNTKRKVPQGYTGFSGGTPTRVYKSVSTPNDYTDETRTNPDLEATRERWNTLYCDSLVPPPAAPFNPVWPALWVIIIVGLCVIASVR